MTDLEHDFSQAAQDVHALSARPDNSTLLQLYALYKQATEGDINGPEPGFFDFVGVAKHKAWAELAGVSKAEAKQRYIDLVRQLQHA
jgi:acyl-CoA-binding protein